MGRVVVRSTLTLAQCQSSTGVNYHSPVIYTPVLFHCCFFAQMMVVGFVLFCFVLATLGLFCFSGASSSCGEQGLLFVVMHRLLVAVASLSSWVSVAVARVLFSAGLIVVAHGLSCSATCGTFPNQGSNPCPLHWQVDS